MLIKSKLCLCPFLWATMLAVGSPVIVLFQLFKRKGETVSLPLRKLAMQATVLEHVRNFFKQKLTSFTNILNN